MLCVWRGDASGVCSSRRSSSSYASALAATGQYVTYSPGPNPHADIERELARWLDVHPHAEAADGFRAGWARRARTHHRRRVPSIGASGRSRPEIMLARGMRRAAMCSWDDGEPRELYHEAAELTLTK